MLKYTHQNKVCQFLKHISTWKFRQVYLKIYDRTQKIFPTAINQKYLTQTLCSRTCWVITEVNWPWKFYERCLPNKFSFTVWVAVEKFLETRKIFCWSKFLWLFFSNIKFELWFLGKDVTHICCIFIWKFKIGSYSSFVLKFISILVKSNCIEVNPCIYKS